MIIPTRGYTVVAACPPTRDLSGAKRDVPDDEFASRKSRDTVPPRFESKQISYMYNAQVLQVGMQLWCILYFLVFSLLDRSETILRFHLHRYTCLISNYFILFFTHIFPLYNYYITIAIIWSWSSRGRCRVLFAIRPRDRRNLKYFSILISCLIYFMGTV